MAIVSSYGLQLVNVNYAAVLASSLDLFITEGDPLNSSGIVSAFTPSQIAYLTGQGRQVIGYVNAAVTDDARYYWQAGWTNNQHDTGTPTDSAPSWLKESIPLNFDGVAGQDALIVKYWKPAWRDIVIAQAVDLVKRGYTRIFLDDVGQYYQVGLKTGDFVLAANQMIDLVADVKLAIIAINPNAILVINSNPYIVTDNQINTDFDNRFINAVDFHLLENQTTIVADHSRTQMPGEPLLILNSTLPAGMTTAQAQARGVLYTAPTNQYNALGQSVYPATSGDDTITGGDGPNQISGLSGNDTLAGGNGNDVLAGGVGNDSIVGGNGIDTASYDGATAGVSVSLAIMAQQNTVSMGLDTLTLIENLTGSKFADTLTGSSLANMILGGNGNDVIDGGTGADILDGGNNDDTLRGGNGNDVVIGGAGNDLIDGGTQIDTVSYDGASGAVTVNLSIKTAQFINAGLGNDTIINVENVTGSSLSDYLTGSTTINILTGGSGRDIMTGNGGNDRFVFNATIDSLVGAKADRITDLSNGDIIDLTGIDAKATSSASNEAFVRSMSLSGVEGQFTLSYVVGTNTTTLLADVNGDAVADMSILFTGDVTGMTGTWLL